MANTISVSLYLFGDHAGFNYEKYAGIIEQKLDYEARNRPNPWKHEIKKVYIVSSNNGSQNHLLLDDAEVIRLERVPNFPYSETSVVLLNGSEQDDMMFVLGARVHTANIPDYGIRVFRGIGDDIVERTF